MDIIKPGKFSNKLLLHNYIVPADALRGKFDEQNETLLRLKKHPKFIFLGDSLTEGYDINSYFGDSSFCINRGIGGDVPMYIYQRLSADVLQLKPEYCILLAGINEIWSLDGEFQSQQQFEELYRSIYDYIITYIEKIVAVCHSTGQKIILCSILPTYGRNMRYGKDANDLITECNARIRELAEEIHCVFVDYHPHFCGDDQKSLRPELSRDGVHLKPEGYDIMSSVLRKTLQASAIEI